MTRSSEIPFIEALEKASCPVLQHLRSPTGVDVTEDDAAHKKTAGIYSSAVCT